MPGMEPRLQLVADTSSWWLQPPPGEPLDLSRFTANKAEALGRLMQQRFTLSEGLQERIRRHEHQRSNTGFCCQLMVGLCLPSCLLGGLLQGSWDYDRDMDVLRKEAAAMLSTWLPPSGYELVEHIDSEAQFPTGKVLFYMYIH